MRTETFVNGKLKDLNPLFFGYDETMNNGNFGMRIRNDVFIHFVKSGNFYFKLREKEYFLKPGEVFIIPPGVPYTYYNPTDRACRITWIALNGELSADFTKLPSVFEADASVFEEIDAVHEAKGRKDVLLSAILMRWYHSLFVELPPKNDRVQAVKNYIENNYMQPLRVEEIADTLHIHRTHLLRIFRQGTGKTIREYLITTRLQMAQAMLCEGKSVAETAGLCGFSSTAHFSKTFKKYYCFTPKEFQKERYR